MGRRARAVKMDHAWKDKFVPEAALLIADLAAYIGDANLPIDLKIRVNRLQRAVELYDDIKKKMGVLT